MTTGGTAMTRQKNINSALLGLCLLACAGAASAQSQPSIETIRRGIYLGGALGQSEAKAYDCTTLAQCENHGSVGKVFLGLQFGRNWALELGLTDLGKVDSENPPTGFTDSVKVRLGEATIMPSYPLSGVFMIYGKVGGYYAQTTNDRNGARIKESNGGITWGGGLQWYITGGLAIRGEAQRYMKVGGGNIGDSDYNAYTVGLLYKMK
jgi:opacity protein-like surface antigen